MKREYYRILRDYVIGWLIAGFIWEVVRFGSYGDPNYALLGTDSRLILFGVLWVGQALVFGLFHILFERLVVGRVQFYKLVLIFLATQLGVGMLAMATAFYLATTFEIPGAPETFSDLVHLRITPASLVFASFINFFIGISIIVNRMIGRGNLVKLIQGQFYKPKVDQRIIMFVDLKSSTKLAEQLGHEKYSGLIQECFHDLAVVYEYHSEVYQYVGDGAILFWDAKRNSNYKESIQAFFRFRKVIESRSKFYLKKFGAVPEFKAGIHVGAVTIAEVGTIKRDVAYHGDTINTAARIQDQTSMLGKTFLASEDFYKKVHHLPDLIAEPVGKIHLKGKVKDVDLYEICEKREYHS